MSRSGGVARHVSARRALTGMAVLALAALFLLASGPRRGSLEILTGGAVAAAGFYLASTGVRQKLTYLRDLAAYKRENDLRTGTPGHALDHDVDVETADPSNHALPAPDTTPLKKPKGGWVVVLGAILLVVSGVGVVTSLNDLALWLENETESKSIPGAAPADTQYLTSGSYAVYPSDPNYSKDSVALNLQNDKPMPSLVASLDKPENRVEAFLIARSNTDFQRPFTPKARYRFVITTPGTYRIAGAGGRVGPTPAVLYRRVEPMVARAQVGGVGLVAGVALIAAGLIWRATTRPPQRRQIAHPLG